MKYSVIAADLQEALSRYYDFLNVNFDLLDFASISNIIHFDGDNANRLSWEVLTKSDSPSVAYVDALTGDILYAVMPIGSAGNS